MSVRKSIKLTDPNFENIVTTWYDELKSDEEIVSDCEDAIETQSEHESVISDTGLSDVEDNFIEERPNDIILGKSGYKWLKKEPPRTKTQRRNIVIKLPGAQGQAKQITSESEAWKILFENEIIEKIVIFTNQEIARQKLNYAEGTRYTQDTDSTEILAFIGVLYISGARKDAHFDIREMFSEQGPKIYKAIMSECRFNFLLTCLRFDNKDVRNREDKFSPIRELWELFIFNCKQSYTPHAYCTIDEQLLGFRGNCPFRVYIGSKPDKYGIKINTLCDSRTYYMVNAIPYIGKEDRSKKQEPIATQVVKQLSEPIRGTNRNITMDNYFTSIPLAEELLNNFKLTIVGTLRHNKKEIPPSFLPHPKKEIFSSQFGFSHKTTIVSFTPKKSKSVILLSTFHSSKSIDEATKKPEIITFYNSTKGGVDTFDQMVHNYTVARKTRRWPLRFFFGMLDQAGINAYVLHNLVLKPEKPARKKFLCELGLQLAQPYMQKRLCGNINIKLRNDIQDILCITPIQDVSEIPKKKTKYARCHLCDRSKDRKTKIYCVKCEKPICIDHRIDMCKSCL